MSATRSLLSLPSYGTEDLRHPFSTPPCGIARAPAHACHAVSPVPTGELPLSRRGNRCPSSSCTRASAAEWAVDPALFTAPKSRVQNPEIEIRMLSDSGGRRALCFLSLGSHCLFQQCFLGTSPFLRSTSVGSAAARRLVSAALMARLSVAMIWPGRSGSGRAV